MTSEIERASPKYALKCLIYMGVCFLTREKLFQFSKKIVTTPDQLSDLSKSVVRFLNGGSSSIRRHRPYAWPNRPQVRVPPRSDFFTFYFCLFLFIFVRNRFSFKNKSFRCKGCKKLLLQPSGDLQ